VCGVQPQPSFGTTVGGVRASNPHLVSRRGSLQRLCIGAWGPSAVEVATTPSAERLGSVLRGRATRVPHQTDNLGIERTTTVTSIRPLSWSSSPDQQERIPRICLIRKRSCPRVSPDGFQTRNCQPAARANAFANNNPD
jgi:hypothetical protein